VTIAGCTVRNMGTVGIEISGGSRHRVVSCDVTGTGEDAIRVSGGDRTTLAPAGHQIVNNHLWRYARWCRTYRPAVLVNGVGIRIAHNAIHDAPHNAILLGGNDHIIEANEISRVCLETGDAGAIYIGRDPTMRGTVIRKNVVRDLAPVVQRTNDFTDVMAVYLDDCACGTTIEGNWFERAGCAVMIGGGRDNTVAGNTFVDCHPAIHCDARAKGWAKKLFEDDAEWGIKARFAAVPYQSPVWRKRYPALATYWEDDPTAPRGNRITGNAWSGGEWITWLDGLTEKDFAVSGNSSLAHPPAHPPAAGLVRDAWRTVLP
jgi:hypothetical protein